MASEQTVWLDADSAEAASETALELAKECVNCGSKTNNWEHLLDAEIRDLKIAEASLSGEIDLDTASIQELVPYPEWMDEYNVRLGGRTPNQAIQDGDEVRVREILISSIVVGIS